MIIRIFLILTIIAFFLPLLSVSCSSRDSGINFSGFEISTGKDYQITKTENIKDYWKPHHPLTFILIVPPAALFILSFFVRKIKSSLRYNICKYIFFILPIFDIFYLFIIKHAFETIFTATVKNKFSNINIIFNIKYGFVLYIIFNVIIFIFAAMNYFAKRE